MSDARTYYVRFLAEALACGAELQACLKEIRAADIPKLDQLEVAPDPFLRIELRSIAGQAFQMDSCRCAIAEKLLDHPAAMDRCAVPDDEQLAANAA